jgi:Histidine kinase
MSKRLFTRHAPVIEALAWVAFYLLVHFNVNDEYLSFWLPMKFVVAVPQTLLSAGMVWGFGWLFAHPLDTPLWKVVLYAVGSFLLLHVVYYYAMQAAQPFAPMQSVTHGRWAFFMAGQGPFYFLRNPRYLLTVSPYFYGLLVCLPLAAKLLHRSHQENERLAAVQQRWLAGEAAALRTRLNPVFFQQTLGHITHLLEQRERALAAEVTLKFAQVLRHTLYAAREEHVPLQQELDAYIDYVYLQELRLQPQVDVTLRLTAEGVAQSTVLSGLLLPLTQQWLALAGSVCELELRVQNAHLTLSLWTDAVTEPGLSATPTVVARLAHYGISPTALVCTQRPDSASLTLHLPLNSLLNRKAVGPGQSGHGPLFVS